MLPSYGRAEASSIPMDRSPTIWRVAATRVSVVEEGRGGNDMARVTGVGGVFLKSADPKALGAWYAKHLGVEVGDYGATFSWKDEVPKGTGMTAWNPFPMDTTYFGEGNQAAMINYRVDDLDALLVDLAAAGVWIDPKRQNESYGRFAWIRDCDGHRVELWQPLETPEM